MASFFYSPSGKSTNTGTSAGSPKRFPEDFYGKTLNAGDQVFFESGATFMGGCSVGDSLASYQVAIPAPSAASPVKFGVYGGTARAKFVTGQSGGDGWSFYSMSGIEFDSIEISSISADPGWGLSWWSDRPAAYSHVYFTNCEVYGFAYGVLFDGTGDPGVKLTDARVTDTSAHGNVFGGIVTQAEEDPTATAGNMQFISTQVLRCVAYNNAGASWFTANHSGSGIYLGQCASAMVDQCLSYANGGNDAGPTGPGGIWFWNCTDSTIQRSIAYGNKRGGGVPYDGNGIGIDYESARCTVQYNLAYNNDGNGIYTFGQGAADGNHVVRFNVCTKNNLRPVFDNCGEVLVSGISAGVKVYNNTMLAGTATAPALCVVGTPTGYRILNNIIAHALSGERSVNAPTAFASTAALLQGNVYVNKSGGANIRWGGTTYTTLATFRAAIANQEMNGATAVGLIGDPLLDVMNNVTDPQKLDTAFPLRLQSGSPAAALGLDVNAVAGSAPGARDFSNKALRASGGSVGALQESLFALNTAQNPNLVQILVAGDDGSLVDFQAQQASGKVAASGKRGVGLKKLNNGSGNPYFTES